jgi:hypothetical protein
MAGRGSSSAHLVLRFRAPDPPSPPELLAVESSLDCSQRLRRRRREESPAPAPEPSPLPWGSKEGSRGGSDETARGGSEEGSREGDRARVSADAMAAPAEGGEASRLGLVWVKKINEELAVLSFQGMRWASIRKYVGRRVRWRYTVCIRGEAVVFGPGWALDNGLCLD